MSTQSAQIRYLPDMRVGEIPTAVDCVHLFIHENLILHLVENINMRISVQIRHVSIAESIMRAGASYASTNTHLECEKPGSTGLDTAKPKLFWICLPGFHGRPCYC
jgi:hypothetical protein